MVHLSRRNALIATGGAAALVGAANLTGATAATRPQGNLSGYAVNLDCWFRDVPFERRFALAREAGFKTIEFWKAARAPGLDASAIRGSHGRLPQIGRETSEGPVFVSSSRAVERDMIPMTGVSTRLTNT